MSYVTDEDHEKMKAAYEAHIAHLIDRLADWERAEMARLPILAIGTDGIVDITTHDARGIREARWRPTQETYTIPSLMVSPSLSAENLDRLISTIANVWADRLTKQLRRAFYPKP